MILTLFLIKKIGQKWPNYKSIKRSIRLLSAKRYVILWKFEIYGEFRNKIWVSPLPLRPTIHLLLISVFCVIMAAWSPQGRIEPTIHWELLSDRRWAIKIGNSLIASNLTAVMTVFSNKKSPLRFTRFHLDSWQICHLTKNRFRPFIR